MEAPEWRKPEGMYVPTSTLMALGPNFKVEIICDRFRLTVVLKGTTKSTRKKSQGSSKTLSSNSQL